MKDWSRKDYARNSIVAGLGGLIASKSGVIFIAVIGDVLILVGIACAVIYFYKTIKERRNK